MAGSGRGCARGSAARAAKKSEASCCRSCCSRRSPGRRLIARLRRLRRAGFFLKYQSDVLTNQKNIGVSNGAISKDDILNAVSEIVPLWTWNDLVKAFEEKFGVAAAAMSAPAAGGAAAAAVLKSKPNSTFVIDRNRREQSWL